MKFTVPLFFLLILVLLQGCTPGGNGADAIYTAGVIHTMDSQWGNVEAMAVKDGRIVDVGKTEQILKKWKKHSTLVVDLKGKTVIPGFIEGHAHFKGLGQLKQIIDFSGTSSWNDVLNLVKEAVGKASPGQWIEGRGWHQEKWETSPGMLIEGYPVNTALNKIAPHNPVYLRHASGHAVMVNAMALKKAGLNATSGNPEGGRIVRFASGEPTGILIENAADPVYAEMRKERDGNQAGNHVSDAYRAAEKECLSYGITSFHDAGSTFAELDILEKMYREGNLRIRLWIMLGEDDQAIRDNYKNYTWRNRFDYKLTVGGIKRYMDGALGSRGAWMFEPYSDMKSTRGLNTISVQQLRNSAELAAELGLQLCTHAIGDRANREVLDIYETVMRAHPERKDFRWRIEHAQHLTPQDIPRFGKLGIIAAMQCIHCTSDGPWVQKRIGAKRAETGAYVWRKILDSHGVIINGTDAPVESVNPLANFYAAITRKMKNGSVFYGKQKMSRLEALKAMTIMPAYAEFAENLKGSLTPGKLADFAILSDDIMTVPEEEIQKIKVLETVIGGKTCYKINEK